MTAWFWPWQSNHHHQDPSEAGGKLVGNGNGADASTAVIIITCTSADLFMVETPQWKGWRRGKEGAPNRTPRCFSPFGHCDWGHMLCLPMPALSCTHCVPCTAWCMAIVHAQQCRRCSVAALPSDSLCELKHATTARPAHHQLADKLQMQLSGCHQLGLPTADAVAWRSDHQGHNKALSLILSIPFCKRTYITKAIAIFSLLSTVVILSLARESS